MAVPMWHRLFLLGGREGYKEIEGTLRDRRDRRDREDKREATISVVRVIPFVSCVVEYYYLR